MRLVYLFIAFLVLTACNFNNNSKLLSDYVNPFVGTGGHGHTYPGAVRPFGMMQLSPDSRLEGWDGCSGYHYSDSIIYGFSHTHLSGTGVSDYGDLLMMPTLGTSVSNQLADGIENSYASYFSHADEIAKPGYYEVFLKTPKIKVELTSTQRCGMHRYEYPKEATKGNIVLDLEHRDQLLDAEMKRINDQEIVGFRRSKAWAKDQHFYFVIQFSVPVLNSKYYNNFEDSIGTKKATKALLEFELPKDKKIIARVGMSTVSIDGAYKNLAAEIKDFHFDSIRHEAIMAWERALGKIKVKSKDKTKLGIFYTALYHTMIAPNLFCDVDGNYRGMDGKIHTTIHHQHYSIFSLWDTFRGAHPLYTLIEPQRTQDFIHSFLAIYEQGGKLPVWELAGNETDCMIGYHSVSVIADAYIKGIRGFDAEKALVAMQASSQLPILGLPAYIKNGVIEMGDNPESVSKTLEYAYDDWCIAQMAKAMGKDSIYRHYSQRAQQYKNVFDPQSKFMRARVNGSWFSPFSPSEVNFNYTEANSWQYSLFVPQDISGLMQLLGGPQGLENYLDSLFQTSSELGGHAQSDITGLIGQYAHGNEPSHHKAYLYNFVGKPHKTQERVQQIMRDLYSLKPDGLSGNEDCGQMSAWYVLSAMGFYSVSPASDYYVIGSPILEEASILVNFDKQFVIKAKKLSDKNIYIQSATLNGKAYPYSYLRHADIFEGGKLIFVMGPKPSQWATAVEHCPKTSIEADLAISPLPHFLYKSSAFTDSMSVEIKALYPEQKLFYSLDGAEFIAYQNPILLKKASKIVAYSQLPNGQKSPSIEGNFVKIDPNVKMELATEYASRYAGGGPQALIDGIRGGNDFRTGFWQGFEGKDLKFTVDLGKEQSLNYIALSCLQDQRSWIWLPEELSFEASLDGKSFKALGQVKAKLSKGFIDSATEEMGIKTATKARYIRVHAKNFGPCPDWHPGKGGNTWIFADELIWK